MSGAPAFYILHGEDSISRAAALQRMRAALGDDGELNCSEFDGDQSSVPEVLAAVKSLPFLADRRLVIAKGLISHITRRGAGKTGKAAVERLIADLPKLPGFARLALVETKTLPASNAVLKAARGMQNGYIGEFKQPRNLAAWVMKRARDAYAAEISPGAAQAIASVVNEDLLRADSELVKLVSYVDGERAIEEADVAALTPYVPEANVFDMAEALAKGDGALALKLIHQALHDNPRDPGFRLFAMIARQFRLLLMTRDHLDRGGGRQPAAIAKAVGAHPFTASKLASQAGRFETEQLATILRRLQRYDQDMKTGRIEPRLALDLLATSLARPS